MWECWNLIARQPWDGQPSRSELDWRSCISHYIPVFEKQTDLDLSSHGTLLQCQQQPRLGCVEARSQELLGSLMWRPWVITCCVPGCTLTRSLMWNWSWDLNPGTPIWNVNVPYWHPKLCTKYHPLRNCIYSVEDVFPWKAEVRIFHLLVYFLVAALIRLKSGSKNFTSRGWQWSTLLGHLLLF